MARPGVFSWLCGTEYWSSAKIIPSFLLLIKSPCKHGYLTIIKLSGFLCNYLFTIDCIPNLPILFILSILAVISEKGKDRC